MKAIAYSNFRKSLKDYFKQVNNNSEPLIVTNKNPEENVVVISKEDFDAIMETLTINSNDYLMQKIARGDQQFKAGKFSQHELIEDDTDNKRSL
ncbi:type II toxin-antitoxin system Phd/YefM family antitoxin [Limosilactobacillus sp. STM2_1]|uniref:Antitoxin n=1 Tax=Limosilactobacillus rudii TaxID=2759755 RepID=A0A7W3YMP5_9LACO|nr:type II toxin-antitoxin system Phd/YefM family antitoxin [Limosilactobacillus rudii]MBB1078711.1 type II toxin-antitoxin system Phd/YefM family antitoxin [Limosilactobacillus rudii]MBB1096721.1 type II toxin-antitoxin system Phd/YefM family antitoxin [Limosilactobacillus rudii]MCD7135607.1 type II toxin-antitoxin system Phd/YefM family antitoxin [Limosilactobacillus rudii]